MKTFSARIAAAGLALLFAATAFAQAPAMTTVKSHVRHLKNGKIVAVKSYTRATPSKTRTVKVKSAVRHLKNGKVVAVKSYTRKVVKKGMK